MIFESTEQNLMFEIASEACPLWMQVAWSEALVQNSENMFSHDGNHMTFASIVGDRLHYAILRFCLRWINLY